MAYKDPEVRRMRDRERFHRRTAERVARPYVCIWAMCWSRRDGSSRDFRARTAFFGGGMMTSTASPKRAVSRFLVGVPS